jgi:hypothetical protein
MRRPPPGGRAGVVERSGSGGVEPGRHPAKSRSLMARFVRGRVNIDSNLVTTSVGRYNICCPIVESSVERQTCVCARFFLTRWRRGNDIGSSKAFHGTYYAFYPRLSQCVVRRADPRALRAGGMADDPRRSYAADHSMARHTGREDRISTRLRSLSVINSAPPAEPRRGRADQISQPAGASHATIDLGVMSTFQRGACQQP